MDPQKKLRRTWKHLGRRIDYTRRVVENPSRYSHKPMTRRTKCLLLGSAAAALALILCLLFVIPFQAQMRMTVSIRPLQNDTVGQEWTSSFTVNGKAVSQKKTVSIASSSPLTIKGTLKEKDDVCEDRGTMEWNGRINGLQLLTGFDVTQQVTVEEKGGRYNGNTAVWLVTCRFDR